MAMRIMRLGVPSVLIVTTWILSLGCAIPGDRVPGLFLGYLQDGQEQAPETETTEETSGGSLDLGFRTYGLSFGNAPKWTGLRFNWQDDDLQRIRGLNLSVLGKSTSDSSLQGLSFYLLGGEVGHLQGVHLATFWSGATSSVTGAQLSPIASTSDGKVDGLQLGLLWSRAGPWWLRWGREPLGPSGSTAPIRGLQIGGLLASAEEVRGLQLSLTNLAQHMRGVQLGFINLSDRRWGVSAGWVNASLESMTGFHVAAANFAGGRDWRRDAEGVVVMTGQLKGVYIGAFNMTGTMKGLSVGIFNHAENLSGIQIGLINHVASNPPWARWLPLVNARF
jgi:hypothetical protein